MRTQIRLFLTIFDSISRLTSNLFSWWTKFHMRSITYIIISTLCRNFNLLTVKNDRILVLIGGLFANNFALVHYSKLKFLHNVDIIMYVMDRIWNLVHHENKFEVNLEILSKMVKNNRIWVLIGGLFVNNFALVHYSKLKFLHKVGIIM